MPAKVAVVAKVTTRATALSVVAALAHVDVMVSLVVPGVAASGSCRFTVMAADTVEPTVG
jgi:hypothetical protein